MSLSMLASCGMLSVMLAVGQILFKYAAIDISRRAVDGLLMAVLSPWLMASLLVYAVSTAVWVWILTVVPLSKAYPFALAAAVLVPLAAHYLFGEPISLRYAIGFGLVVTGLVVAQLA